MTIGTTLNTITVEGNGATTAFAYPFLMPSASDAVVIYTTSAGVQTPLESTQYSISGIGLVAGGTVTYPLAGSPIATGSYLTITRILPEIQSTSISNQGPTYTAIEGALDYLTMEVQQVQNEANRAIQINPADITLPTPLPIASVRAGQTLVFDSNGNPTVGIPVSGGTVSTAMAPVIGAATIMAADALLGIPFVAPSLFGAVGNGIADDTVAMQAAINYAVANALALYMPGATYKITSTLTVAGPLTIRGVGRTGSVISLGTAAMTGITVTTQAPVAFESFEITGASTTGNTTAILVQPASGANTESIFRDLQIISINEGINTQAAANFTIDNCFFLLYTGVGVLVRNTSNADQGDSAISNCYFQGASSSSLIAAIQQQSSGGLKIVNTKMVTGGYGYVLELDPGAVTADLLISNCSVEGMSVTGVALTQSASAGSFGNVVITGNQFNLVPEAVGLTNITPGWLIGLNITGNDFQINAGGTAISLDGVTGFNIGSNFIAGLGANVALATISSNCANCELSLNGNVEIASYVTNSSVTTAVEPRVITGTTNATTANAYGSLFASNGVAVSFPTSSFINAPSVQVTATAGSGAVSGIPESIAAAGFTIVGIGATNSVTLTLSWTASGH